MTMKEEQWKIDVDRKEWVEYFSWRDKYVVHFDIRQPKLFRLVVSNLILMVLTLGIYRFWARTRLRRLYWSSISIKGQPFSYTGTGTELLVGFLIALVFLLPLLTAIGLVNALIPPADFEAKMIFLAFVTVLFAFLGIFAQFYTRRYVLSRTEWRQVRAGQDATIKEWLRDHTKTALINLMTLGLLVPRTAIERYKFAMSHTWFGTARFSADPKVEALFRQWILTWLVLVAAIFSLLVGFFPLLPYSAVIWASLDLRAVVPSPIDPNLLGVGVALILLAGGFYLWLQYKIVQFNHFLTTTTIGGVKIKSDVCVCNLLLSVLWFICWIFVSGFICFFLAKFFYELLPRHSGSSANFLTFAGIVVYLFHLYIVYLVFLIPTFIHDFTSRINLIALHELDEVLNRASPAPRRGEGLAEAIGDVGV